jgi:hypothetical protein
VLWSRSIFLQEPSRYFRGSSSITAPSYRFAKRASPSDLAVLVGPLGVCFLSSNNSDGVVCKPQEISALAKRVWECYHKTFAIVCKFPDLKERYEKIALEFGAIRDESELYSKTFSGLMGS